MGTRENKVERYLDSEVVKLGGLTRKWVSPGRDGVPDRIVVINSVVWFVEIKTIDGVTSEVQKREHQRLIDCGANVATVYGNTGVDMFIREELNNGKS
ncbi:VRR-NUC domain-containing protein [Vibrio phage PS25B.1]|nr:VRR-NUC domain-containing protein [Vibrio phage PS25B.1]